MNQYEEIDVQHLEKGLKKIKKLAFDQKGGGGLRKKQLAKNIF